MSRKTRKLIWSVPLLAVLAVAGALAMFAAQGPGGVSATPLPAAPMNLEVAAADGDAGRTMLVLTWDAAANATGYRIDKSDQGAVWETMMMDTGDTMTTYTDTLTASDTRWYRVFAVNDHGVGPVSNAASGTTNNKVNPGSVMNLRATPNAKNPRTRLDLTWDPPANDGGEMIVGYEIQAHIGGDWLPVDEATAGQVTVATKNSYMDPTNRDPGDSQLYRVRAVNGTTKLTATAAGVSVAASEDGDASKEWVSVTGTTQAATAPGQVTGLTAVNADGTTINLYWYDPEDNGGWDISGYLIQAHRQGKRFPSIPDVGDLTAITPTSGVNLGAGDAIDNATFYFGPPTNTNPYQAQFGTIAPVDHDGDTATDTRQVRWYFRVFALTTDDGPNNDADATDDTIRRSASASNTASDTPAVRAIDHDDDTTTTALDPLAPPTLGATSTGNTPPDAKKQQIDLSVTVAQALTDADPDVEQIAYRIDYSEGTGDDAGKSWKLLERDTRFTGFGPDRPYEDDDGLGFDESRTYRVFAIGRDPYTDVGPASAIATGITAASTVPNKPTGVMASSPSLRSVEASWTAPMDNGGQPITKYLVQWVKDDADGVAEAADFTTNTDSSLANDATDDAMTMATFDIAAADALDEDTVYVFRVAGVNRLGTTERPSSSTDTTNVPKWSDPILFSTTDADKPNAVEGLTSEAASDTSGIVTGVNLLWNKPSDKIGITDYDIEVMNEHGDWVNPTGGQNWTATRTSYTDPDEPGADEMRTYRVRASNAVGDGPWTMVYYPRDPAADHTHDTMLTAPGNVLANGTATAGEIVVTWTPGENAVGHVIVVLDNGDNFALETTAVPTMDGQHTLMGLPAGMYTVVVVSFKSATDYTYESSGTATDSVDIAVVN